MAENPLITEINVKIEQVTAEIEKLLDKISSADGILMDYINKRVAELDAQVKVYRQQISELSPLTNIEKNNISELRDYMQHWDELSYDDKRAVVDQLIAVIKATENSCEITWKI